MIETPRDESLNLYGLLGDFRLLVILFIGFRLMLLIVYQPLVIDPTTEPVLPEATEQATPEAEIDAAITVDCDLYEVGDVTPGVERGLGAMGDRRYHYALARRTACGEWPFLDWWSEFPPVWYTVTTTVYQAQGENADYSNWSVWLGFIVLAFDVGNLILMRAIGSHLYGARTGMALAWVYAVALAPMVFLFWNFETLVAFFLLLGLYYMLKGRDNRGAVAIAAGALTKFTPALLFGALIRYRTPRTAVQTIAIAAGIFAAVYGLLYLNANANDVDPAFVTASLTSQYNKASYQTAWALVDGNYTTGNFGSVESHFDVDAANELYGEPATIPGFLRLAVAAGIGLFVFVRTRRMDDRGLVAFVTITLLIFFLQSQGWSPQWLTQIIPLVLLCFPSKNGVYVTVLLSFLAFTEYPLLFLRTGDTGGVIEGAMRGPFAALIAGRTLLLVAICVALYSLLRQPRNRDGSVGTV